MNSVTVFQGLLNYRLTYPVGGEPTTILLPFKKEHLCDAANIAVLGDDVEEVSVSFPPTNAADTALDLTPDKALEVLTTSLSGAGVELLTSTKEVIKGALIGTDTDKTLDAHGFAAPKTWVSVLVATGAVRRVALSDLTQLVFTDKEVQQEIAKALAKNYQKIKPGSKYLTIVLKSKSGNPATATLDYTTPGAPWSAVYTLRRDANGFTLDARGIVHNNTESDWENYKIRLVSGSPGDFSTDVADQVTPTRRLVQIAPRTAVGGAEAGEGWEQPLGVQPVQRMVAAGARAAAAPPPAASPAARSYAEISMGGGSGPAPIARQESQTSEEGDFVVYEPEATVNIPANSVSPVHLFSKRLKDAFNLLFYKFLEDPVYPWSAIKFTNELTHGLSRGPCDVFLGDLAAGKCVLPMVKPGETRMLLHARETGVRVQRTPQPGKTAVYSRIVIDKGTALTEITRTHTTTYHIKNVRNQEFDFQMDHMRNLASPSYQTGDAPILEWISNGVRLGMRLAAKSESVVTVVESQVDSTTVVFADQPFDERGLTATLLSIKEPAVANIRSLDEVLRIREKMTAVGEEVGQLGAKTAAAEKDVLRIRENAKIVDGLRRDSYMDAIDTLEKSIAENAKRAEELELAKKQLAKELVAALKQVTISWKS